MPTPPPARARAGRRSATGRPGRRGGGSGCARRLAATSRSGRRAPAARRARASTNGSGAISMTATSAPRPRTSTSALTIRSSSSGVRHSTSAFGGRAWVGITRMSRQTYDSTTSVSSSASTMRYSCTVPSDGSSQLSEPPKLSSPTWSRRRRYAPASAAVARTAWSSVPAAPRRRLGERVEQQHRGGVPLRMLLVDDERAAARRGLPVHAAYAVAGLVQAEVGELDPLALLPGDEVARRTPACRAGARSRGAAPLSDRRATR